MTEEKGELSMSGILKTFSKTISKWKKHTSNKEVSTTTTSHSYLDGIPDSILSLIFVYFDLPHILSATLVCKRFAQILRTEFIWGTLFIRAVLKICFFSITICIVWLLLLGRKCWGTPLYTRISRKVISN